MLTHNPAQPQIYFSGSQSLKITFELLISNICVQLMFSIDNLEQRRVKMRNLVSVIGCMHVSKTASDRTTEFSISLTVRSKHIHGNIIERHWRIEFV